jgi:hypothetical protein
MIRSRLTKEERWYGSLLVFFVVSSLLPAVLWRLSGQKLSPIWLAEDGIYESLAAIACLVAGLVFLYAFIAYPKTTDGVVVKGNRNWFALVFAVLLILLFAEEISWGQRIFGLGTPEIISQNSYQREINLHNLKILGRGNNTLSMSLFELINAYLIVLPLAVYAFPSLRRIVQRLGVPIPSLQIALFATIIRLLNVASYRLVYGDSSARDVLHIGEIRESNVELLLLVLAIEYLLMVRTRGAPR